MTSRRHPASSVCVCARVHACRVCAGLPPGCRLSALRPRPVHSDGDGRGESGDAAADGCSSRPVPWQLLVSCPIRTKAQEEAGAVSQKKHNSAGLGGMALCRSPSPPPTPGRVPCDCPVGAQRGSVQPPGGDCWSSAMRGGASACCRESSCSGPPQNGVSGSFSKRVTAATQVGAHGFQGTTQGLCGRQGVCRVTPQISLRGVCLPAPRNPSLWLACGSRGIRGNAASCPPPPVTSVLSTAASGLSGGQRLRTPSGQSVRG